MGEIKPQFTVKALIIKDNKFLAVHKTTEKTPLMELVGGRMEFRETAEKTLEREVFEETGLCVKQIKLLDTWNLVKDTFQVTGIIYLCTITSGKLTLSDEHNRYEWLDLDSSSVKFMQDCFAERMRNWDWNFK